RPPRTNIHNAASAIADHMRHNFAREQINSLQRHIEGKVPFVFSEFDDILTNGNPGAVAENVDLARLFNYDINGAPAFGAAADIAVQKDRRTSVSFDFGRNRASFDVIDVDQRYERSHLSHPNRNAAPDPRCRPSDDGDLSLQRQKL